MASKCPQPPASFRSRLEGHLMRPLFTSVTSTMPVGFFLWWPDHKLIRDKLKIPDTRILEIPGGIGEEWLVDEPSPISSPRRFIFLGRYERRKGIEELHQALRKNPSWAGKAEFRLIGPIPEEKRLRLSHVSYSGPIRDSAELREELHRGDVLICPSHSEGMPNSILEAMACGLAVIATDVGAVAAIVNPENGILLNKPTGVAIADAITEMIDAPQVRLRDLKTESLKKAAHFGWEKISTSSLELIRQAQSRH